MGNANYEYTYNWCPKCGYVLRINNKYKTQVCLNCGTWVVNYGYEGFNKESKGCTSLFYIIALVIMLPFVLIGCIILV